jgi:hypothetical protein
MTNPLINFATPWSLHFDRDGTEDYGIICDADGNDLVASHLPQSNVARLADRPFGTGCFWLPENEDDEMPLLARQMQLMTAAPKLLAMLRVAIVSADAEKQEWLKEAGEAIAEATGQEQDATAEETPHLYKAAPSLYAAVSTAYALLGEYKQLAEAIHLLFNSADGLADRIEKVREQMHSAIYEANHGSPLSR